MKKLVFIILSIFIIFLFSGCGDLDIKCSISKSNVAAMEIIFKLNFDDLSDNEYSIAENALEDLSVYWKNSLGFEVEEYDKGIYYGVKLTKKVKCDNKEEAANAMLEMMGADASPFANVEGGYVSSYLNEYVNIAATVDLTQMIDYDYVNSLPASEREYIYENLNKFSGNVIFDIDGKIIEHVGKIDKETVSAGLSMDSPTEIYSLVEMPNAKNQTEFDTLQDKASQHDKIKKSYLMYMILAASLLFLLILAMVANMIVKKSKAKKSETENSSDREDTNQEEASQPEQTQAEPNKEEK